MYCPNCGKDNIDTGIFCSFCGKQISGSVVKEDVGQLSQTRIELKKMSVFFLIILTIFTAGIYVPIWFLKQRDAINRLYPKLKFGPHLFIIAIVVYSLFFLMNLINLMNLLIAGSTFDVLSTLSIRGFSSKLASAPLGVIVAYLYGALYAILIPVTLLTSLALKICCFDFLYVIQQSLNIKSTWSSSTATYLFDLFYVQYRINRL